MMGASKGPSKRSKSSSKSSNSALGRGDGPRWSWVVTCQNVCVCVDDSSLDMKVYDGI